MIQKLLKHLQEQAIAYVILNGYEELFNGTTYKGDVDILFKEKTFAKIESILELFCELEHYKIVQIYHQEVYAKNIFLFNPKTGQLLNLDLYGRLHRKNTTFFSEEDIFTNVTTFKGSSIPAPHHEFFHYLLKKIDKNNFTQTSFDHLRSLYMANKESCSAVLKQNFVSKSDLIIKSFEKNNLEEIQRNQRVLMVDVIENNAFNPIQAIKNNYRILKRILRPTGIAISFLGPDGSGKSTIIKGLFDKISPYRNTAYFHLKPIVHENTNKHNVTHNPHKYKPYSKLKSYGKLLYFIGQYNIGWVKNIITLKIRSTLVVFDRYFDDLLVDTKRYRYGGGIVIAKLSRVFIKKPELYFILTADADVIYARKQEVERTELETQIEAYRALADNKTYFNIDTNRSPEEIVNEVFSVLMKKMNGRY